MSKHKHLVMVTTNGTTKKTSIDDFQNVRRSGLIAIKLESDDQLKWVQPSSGKDEIMIITSHGQAIRFKESGVRAMGRSAKGVRGMRIKSSDIVVGMDVVSPDEIANLQLLVISEKGLGKRTGLSNYKVQGRGGSGIKTMAVTAKTGPIIAATVVDKSKLEDIMMISVHGQVVRIPMKGVSTLGRATQGVRVMRFKKAGDKVANIAVLDSDSAH